MPKTLEKDGSKYVLYFLISPGTKERLIRAYREKYNNYNEPDEDELDHLCEQLIRTGIEHLGEKSREQEVSEMAKAAGQD